MITWTNVDFSLVMFCGIHVNTTSQLSAQAANLYNEQN